MSEENIALDRAVAAMIRMMEKAEEEGKNLQEAKAVEDEQAEIERIAQELRMTASGYLIKPTETG